MTAAVATYVYSTTIQSARYQVGEMPSCTYLLVLWQEYDSSHRLWSYVQDESGQYSGYVLDAMLTRVSSTPKPTVAIELWKELVHIDEVRLEWQCSAYGMAYELQRQEGEQNSNWVTIWKGMVSADRTPYFDSSVTDGQIYRYRVVVEGQNSNVLTVNIPELTVEFDLQVEFVSDNSLKLTWGRNQYVGQYVAKYGQYVTYTLQRQVGEYGTWEKVYNGDSNSFYDRGLMNGETYRYRVIVNGPNVSSTDVAVHIDP